MLSVKQLTASALFESDGSGYAIVVTGHSEPRDTEWAEYIALCSVGTQKYGKTLRGFTLTLGGSPTAKQRKQLRDAVGTLSTRGAIVTDSALVRGVVTALNWMTQIEMQAFRMNDLKRALAYIELKNHTGLEALLWSLGELIEGPNPAAALRLEQK